MKPLTRTDLAPTTAIVKSRQKSSKVVKSRQKIVKSRHFSENAPHSQTKISSETHRNRCSHLIPDI